MLQEQSNRQAMGTCLQSTGSRMFYWTASLGSFRFRRRMVLRRLVVFSQTLSSRIIRELLFRRRMILLRLVVFSQTLSFSAHNGFIQCTVVEIDRRLSSKPTHAQMTAHVILAVTEPSIVEKRVLAKHNSSRVNIQYVH